MLIRIDRKTRKDRSLFFITAFIPMKKAIMLAENEKNTVTSHQWSSKDSILNTLTRMMEIITDIKKKVFSPTDHFPGMVFGADFSFTFFSPSGRLIA